MYMDKNTNSQKDTVVLHKSVAAAIIAFAILLGIILLTRIFDYATVAQYWPVLIILAGFVLINGSAKSAVSGVAVMLAGGLLLAGKFELLGGSSSQIVEVLTLVVIALLVLTIAAPGTTKPSK